MTDINQTAKDVRYSYGPKWNKSVRTGAVRDFRKLIAHAAKVKAISDIEEQEWMSKLDDLRVKVSEQLALIPAKTIENEVTKVELDADVDTSENDVEESTDIQVPMYNPDTSVAQGASI